MTSFWTPKSRYFRLQNHFIFEFLDAGIGMKSQNHPEIKIDAENKNRPKNEIRAGKQNSIFGLKIKFRPEKKLKISFWAGKEI